MKYICSNCQAEFLKWEGKCSSCGEWGTLEEIQESTVSQTESKASNYKTIVEAVKTSSSSSNGKKYKHSTGYEEFDRVLGGGYVLGEVMLISGEPGVGKSTLLSQIALNIAEDKRILYICGEESPHQLYSRLERLLDTRTSSNKAEVLKNFLVVEDVDVDNICKRILEEHFDLVIIDSIQSVSSQKSRGYPGSISQVRISGAVLTRVAKISDTPMFIVGQINKGGDIAGPKVLEHIVDCVLYIEGDEYNQYRIVRGMKNRFGSTNEVGVFEMTSSGLEEISNPSLVFLEGTEELPGSVIGAVIQGTRVVFVEVQALVSLRRTENSDNDDISPGPRKRVSNGIKKQRLDMLCAVMTKRGNCFLGNADVYVNIVGGLNINDPAIDLAVCAAIKSSYNDTVVDREKVFFGEVGLTGEVRGTWGVDAVISEAERVGYKELVVGEIKSKGSKKLSIKKVSKVNTL